MADIRNCEQCGAEFDPLGQHARFCSARCRLTWGRQNTGGQHGSDTALGWSLTAMAEAANRLCKVGATDVPEALAVVSEAVWWVTLVDAAMMRSRPAAYEHALVCLDPAERRTIEGILTGLKFVRSRMGYQADPADFIQPEQDSVGGDALPAAWTWSRVPAAVPAALPPGTRTGETTRFLHYRAYLAGRPIGETIARAIAFLTHLYPVP